MPSFGNSDSSFGGTKRAGAADLANSTEKKVWNAYCERYLELTAFDTSLYHFPAASLNSLLNLRNILSLQPAPQFRFWSSAARACHDDRHQNDASAERHCYHTAFSHAIGF